MTMDDLEQAECAHNAYHTTLQYRNLVGYIASSTHGRRYLQGFCLWLTKGVEEGTVPYPLLNGDDFEPFLFR